MNSQNRKLHIVAFGNPYPPTYGGAIDVYYKLKTLSQEGILIYLHFFDDELGDISKLKVLCEDVYFYKKKRHFLYFFSAIPYAIKIRHNALLQYNINKVKAPILFEGLQSCFYLLKSAIDKQKCFVRIHNNEENYYLGLANSETNVLKKLVYRSQAKKMKRFVENLHGIKAAITLSFDEQAYFSEILDSEVHYIPVFHSNSNIVNLSSTGSYALYHGDLSISDNYRTAMFFIEVFKGIPYSLIIAGSSRLDSLNKIALHQENISVVKITNNDHLDSLFHDAHINVLASFQRSGTKLKVINALYKSRFCLINENVVDDPSILSLCSIATDKNSFRDEVKRLMMMDYDSKNRLEVLNQVYNNKSNSLNLINVVYPTQSS